ncbi:hypothetical protein DFJ77DRAFT_186017 [Powellomyces hirtus]|nr:hypothetical protein DFJ77DRAFT_186017 [Powellomyces hirtus]
MDSQPQHQQQQQLQRQQQRYADPLGDGSNHHDRITQRLAFMSATATLIARVWLILVIAALVFIIIQPTTGGISDWIASTTTSTSSSSSDNGEARYREYGPSPPPPPAPALEMAWTSDEEEDSGMAGKSGQVREMLVNITYLPFTTQSPTTTSADLTHKRRKPETLTAVPALFGRKFDHPIQFHLITIEGQTGCMPFTVDLNPAELETSAGEIYILLPRGGCPFDTKVRHAQQAGFTGVIVHNVVSSQQQDLPVKMQTVDGKKPADIVIPALFLTSADGRSLRDATHDISMPHMRAVQVIGTPLDVQVTPAKYAESSWTTRNGRYKDGRRRKQQGYPVIDPDQNWDGVFEGFWGDAFISAVCLILGALGAMAVGASLVLLHNRMFDALGIEYTNTLMRNQHTNDNNAAAAAAAATRNLARVVISTDGEMMVERIRLPLRELTQDDVDQAKKGAGQFAYPLPSSFTSSALERSSSSGTIDEDGSEVYTSIIKVAEKKPLSTDCCAICIDEFTAGCRVRELPCRHCFHDLCIDPWLLHHALLCPVCKRDIIPSHHLSPASPLHPATTGPVVAGPPPPRHISSIAIIVDDQAPLVRPANAIGARRHHQPPISFGNAFNALAGHVRGMLLGTDRGDNEDR